MNRSLNASLKWLLRACSTKTDGLPSIVPTPSLMALPDRLRPVPTKSRRPCSLDTLRVRGSNRGDDKEHSGGEKSIQCQERSIIGGVSRVNGRALIGCRAPPGQRRPAPDHA